MKQLILASGSPRRKELLERENIPFNIIVSDTDEYTELPPREAVRELAKRKALAVAPMAPGCTVLAADTLVDLNGTAMGKPIDETQAYEMIRALSGRTHSVHTGIYLLNTETGYTVSDVCDTYVTFKELSDDEIRAYIASGDYRGKAGAYAIQSLGGALVAGYDGDYDNIVGLPVYLVKRYLADPHFQ